MREGVNENCTDEYRRGVSSNTVTAYRTPRAVMNAQDAMHSRSRAHVKICPARPTRTRFKGKDRTFKHRLHASSALAPSALSAPANVRAATTASQRRSTSAPRTGRAKEVGMTYSSCGRGWSRSVRDDNMESAATRCVSSEDVGGIGRRQFGCVSTEVAAIPIVISSYP